jgi:NlpC/P60 family putative phage cell wall peptidase
MPGNGPISLASVFLEAKACLGTPYHHQGRKKGLGMDCVGLVIHLAQFTKTPFKDRLDYDRHASRLDLMDELGRWLIPVAEPQPGDVLVFWTRRPGRATHAGIKSAYGMIHTHASIGRVVENGLDAGWMRRLAGSFRFHNVRV